MKSYLTFFLLSTNIFLFQSASGDVFDSKLYEDVLDPELCSKQLVYLQRNLALSSKYLDAGARFPKAVYSGNFIDLGSYYECLGIHEFFRGVEFEGKYCVIKVPVQQNFSQLPIRPFYQEDLQFSEEFQKEIYEVKSKTAAIEELIGFTPTEREFIDPQFANAKFTVAVCIPKPCTSKQFIDHVLSGTKLSFTQQYCRLPNDKPWAVADYVALSFFGVIGVLTVLSTWYDVRQTVVLKNDPKSLSRIYTSFSVYTNTRKLLTFNYSSGTLHCLDGLRTISMMGVIIGHTFSARASFTSNTRDLIKWGRSLESLWVMSVPLAVDTFFMLSGLLIVYTTLGKFSGMKLLKNLHLYYLHRILRTTPILLTIILLHTSVFHWYYDGPNWDRISSVTDVCRQYWWTNLLYIQNLVQISRICLGHSWYLTVDMQLHILSPIVLFWVLRSKRAAWTSMVTVLLVNLTLATVYIFNNNFNTGFYVDSDTHRRYLWYYYYNPLTRAPPFLIGMICGYALNTWRGKFLTIPKALAFVFWICNISVAAYIIYTYHIINQPNWDNQFGDNMLNSFMRPAWAVTMSWLIIACVHGYAGPVNWFLSLSLWKLPSRLSYAFYLVHYPLINIVYSMELSPLYFNLAFTMFTFFSILVMTAILSFLITILFDLPCSTLTKLLLVKKPQEKSATS